MSSVAVLATFGSEHDLVAAVRAARRSGLAVRDAYTPYAVHGLDEQMGLRPSRLSWLCALLGAAGFLFMLWFIPWCTAVDWPINVGGKPWNSLLAYVPVLFESMVFCAGVGVVIAFLIVSRLRPGRPARLVVPGITQDRFALVVEQVDSSMDVRDVQELLREQGAIEVRPVPLSTLASGQVEQQGPLDEERTVAASNGRPYQPRHPIRRINLTLAALTAILLLAATVLPGSPARRSLEWLPNMVWSPARDAYQVAESLPQARSPVPGTIAREAPAIMEFPATDAGRELAGKLLKNPYKPSDQAALARGRVVFQTYCACCHNRQGLGGGPVTLHGYPSPPPFPSAPAKDMPDGSLFHIITYGWKNMPPHRAIVNPDDRWKAILYVRKLEQGQGPAGAKQAQPAAKEANTPAKEAKPAAKQAKATVKKAGATAKEQKAAAKRAKPATKASP